MVLPLSGRGLTIRAPRNTGHAQTSITICCFALGWLELSCAAALGFPTELNCPAALGCSAVSFASVELLTCEDVKVWLQDQGIPEEFRKKVEGMYICCFLLYFQCRIYKTETKLTQLCFL